MSMLISNGMQLQLQGCWSNQFNVGAKGFFIEEDNENEKPKKHIEMDEADKRNNAESLKLVQFIHQVNLSIR